MILLNLYGILIKTCFYLFLLYTVQPMKSLASVGLDHSGSPQAKKLNLIM